MAGDITVPGAGKVPKKVAIGVGVVVGGGVIFLYWRRRKTASASAAPTVDPATGSLLNADGSYQNPAPVRSVDNTVDASGGTAILTNSQWVQYALSLMPNWDPSYLQVALGNFLSDQPLDHDQAAAVRAAEGLAGPPPEGNHVIIMSQAGGSPGTPPPTTPTAPSGPVIVYVPHGVNLYDVAAQHNAPDGLNTLRAFNPGLDSHITWQSVPGPAGTPKLALVKDAAGINIRVS